MKCPKCGSKYITVVNRPIQLKEKTYSMTIDLFTGLSIGALILGAVVFFITIINNSNATLEKVAAYTVSLASIKWSSITLVFIGIINAIRPHKMDNKLIGVCMECGHDAELNTFKETTEATTPGESKAE